MSQSNNDFPKPENKNKQFYIYKWYFEFYDSDNVNTKIHPDKVLGITKQSYYKTKVVPVLSGKFRFLDKDLVTLKSIRKRCLCTITCKSIIYNPTTGEHATKSNEVTYVKSDSKIEFSATFEPIFDKNTFLDRYNEDDIEKNAEKEEIKAPEAEVNSPTQVTNITFFNLKAQNVIKTLFNNVIESGENIGTVLQWICSETGLNYIIDKPANETELGETILPTLTLIPAINYLQEMYGVYENGIQPFIDFDNVLYVLDKYSMEHDKKSEDTSITHVYSYDINESEPMSMIRAENDDKEAMYIGIPVIHNEDDEVLKGELLGNNYIFSSFDLGLDPVKYNTKNEVVPDSAEDVSFILKRNTETHNSSGEKSICDYDELNNIYNMTSKFNEVESQAKKLTIRLQNVNISDFNVNKIIDLHYQNITKNNSLGGKYYLNEAIFVFKSIPSGDLFKNDDDADEDEDLGYTPAKTSCGCAIAVSRRYK